MSIWFISDCHFNHENIIKYCDRPYKTVDEMNSQLIKNWNYWIKNDDLVYNLGDFCLGNKATIASFVSKLNGRKFLILGNHDRYKPRDYMDMGFEWVSRFPIIYDEFVILSHEPVFLNGNSQPYFNLHGHTHNSEPLFDQLTPWHMNISIENTEYLPINYNKIKSIIQTGESVTKLP
jgi:calcineurin-like phosphoesterase family protein